MDRADLEKMSEFSPFELKDTLVALASRHSERLMLNAGRGNPNFLSMVPRHGFFQIGLFAMREAERSFGDMREGVGGLPKPEGIAGRFEIFAQARQETPGVAFLSRALSYVREQLVHPRSRSGNLLTKCGSCSKGRLRGIVLDAARTAHAFRGPPVMPAARPSFPASPKAGSHRCKLRSSGFADTLGAVFEFRKSAIIWSET